YYVATAGLCLHPHFQTQTARKSSLNRGAKILLRPLRFKPWESAKPTTLRRAPESNSVTEEQSSRGESNQ
ncbi:MAG: hypothetical protein WB608_07110, partial [Terracidiphilus sp.]